MSKYTKEKILRDYSIACLSREASLLGRKEVLAGKAKFGIFGAGKELSQIAAANASKPGEIGEQATTEISLLYSLQSQEQSISSSPNFMQTQMSNTILFQAVGR